MEKKNIKLAIAVIASLVIPLVAALLLSNIASIQLMLFHFTLHSGIIVTTHNLIPFYIIIEIFSIAAIKVFLSDDSYQDSNSRNNYNFFSTDSFEFCATKSTAIFIMLALAVLITAGINAILSIAIAKLVMFLIFEYFVLYSDIGSLRKNKNDCCICMEEKSSILIPAESITNMKDIDNKVNFFEDHVICHTCFDQYDKKSVNPMNRARVSEWQYFEGGTYKTTINTV